MIARDLPPKLGNLIATSPQIGRAKTSLAHTDDAECFQRLTASEQFDVEVKAHETETENRPAIDLGLPGSLALQSVLLPPSFYTPILAPGGKPSHGVAVEPALSHLTLAAKKPVQMAGLIGMKGAQESAEHGLKTAAKVREKFQHLDLPKDEHVQKIAVPAAQKSVAGTASETLTNILATQQHPPVAQTQSLRIADLPHVTRVQIDQTKRSASGALSSLELVLEPAELGRITAKLQHEEGRVILVLSAEHGQIAQDLMRDSSMLIRALEGYIPNVRSIEISIQSEARQAMDFQEFSHANWHAKGQDRKPDNDRTSNLKPMDAYVPTEVDVTSPYSPRLHYTI